MGRFAYNLSILAQRQALLGLTDTEVARRARCCIATVRNVRLGRTCKPPTVRAIADALEVDMAELLATPADGGNGNGEH